MLLQWALLWNTEKDRGAKRQRSTICKVQTSRASEGLHWVCLVREKGGLVGCMPVIGVRWSIYLPAHTGLRHRLCFLHSAVAKLTFWQQILLYHQNVTGCLCSWKALSEWGNTATVPINHSSSSVTRINFQSSNHGKHWSKQSLPLKPLSAQERTAFFITVHADLLPQNL